jgi:cytochrome d ubiquinol oxidase subunit I
MTPFLTRREATISLIVYCATYTFIFAFGIFYIYRLLRAGPLGHDVLTPPASIPSPPLHVDAKLDTAHVLHVPAEE